MKKYARLFSVIALILAITFIFSGCGLIDYASSILKKDTTADTTGIPTDNVPAGDIVYDNVQPTDSVIVAPPASTDTSVPTQSPTQAATQSQTQSNSSTKPSAPSTTQSTPPTTNTPAVTEPITEEEIKDLSVKGLQDLLFATEDPNTAGKILETCGFQYDAEQGIYYSTMEPLQRYFGFNFLYDMAAPIAGMHYDTERIQFNYGGKDWMIQIWKGQYGITAGAEIGVYNKTDKIMQYDCASNDELLEMSFDFYNQDEYVFSRGPEKHWWLTGFKIFNAGVGMLIDLDITIKFPDIEMANAFEKGLKKAAKDNFTDPMTYTRTSLTFKIHW